MWCAVKSCKNTQREKSSDQSFHRFPKDEVLKQIWIKSLNIAADSLVPISVVCSDHFKENDFKPKKGKGILRRLHGYAVPFVNETVHKQQQHVQTNMVIHSLPKLVHSEHSVTSESTETITDPVEKYDFKESTTSTQKPKIMSLKVEMVTTQGKSYALRKRKQKVLKNRIKDYEKIKVINRKLRCKSLELASMEEILNDFKNKNIISDKSTEILEELCGPTLDLFELHLRKIAGAPKTYEPKIKDFARNLNFLSSEAYLYVRETFNNCLPDLQTIHKWDMNRI